MRLISWTLRSGTEHIALKMYRTLRCTNLNNYNHHDLTIISDYLEPRRQYVKPIFFNIKARRIQIRIRRKNYSDPKH